MEYFFQSKIMSAEELQKNLHTWRMRGDVIVFTNGCFDILHPGHVEYLQEAARLGNRLVIGLNSDASVSRLKGAGRPVNPQSTRAVLLAALHHTDAVVVFDEDTPLRLIQQVKPDILAKGADYDEDKIVGAAFVKEYGGRVERIALKEGYSSTAVIQKIKNS